MTVSPRRTFGIALVIALIIALVALVALLVNESESNDILIVHGSIGSEKIGFLDSPKITEILADRYGLEVNYSAAGSLAIMENAPGDQDFLWPASQIADEARFDPAPRSEELFYSPIVLYSWS